MEIFWFDDKSQNILDNLRTLNIVGHSLNIDYD